MVQSLPPSDGFRILFNSPELSEVQRSGFHLFLKKGIAEELSKISCIQLKHAQFLIEIVVDANNFRLITPENNYRDCILKMKSYTCKLYVQTRIVFKDKVSGELLYQTRPEWVLLADLPMMTKRGHFVINGSPRVIVHQVGRAPGVYFKKVLKVKKDVNNKARFYGDIIPRKGVWVRLQINKKGEIDLKLKKSKKVRAEMVQKCLELLEKEESKVVLFKSKQAIAQPASVKLSSSFASTNGIQQSLCKNEVYAKTKLCKNGVFALHAKLKQNFVLLRNLLKQKFVSLRMHGKARNGFFFPGSWGKEFLYSDNNHAESKNTKISLLAQKPFFFSPQTSFLAGIDKNNCGFNQTRQTQAFVTGLSLNKPETAIHPILYHAKPWLTAIPKSSAQVRMISRLQGIVNPTKFISVQSARLLLNNFTQTKFHLVFKPKVYQNGVLFPSLIKKSSFYKRADFGSYARKTKQITKLTQKRSYAKISFLHCIKTKQRKNGSYAKTSFLHCTHDINSRVLLINKAAKTFPFDRVEQRLIFPDGTEIPDLFSDNRLLQIDCSLSCKSDNPNLVSLLKKKSPDLTNQLSLPLGSKMYGKTRSAFTKAEKEAFSNVYTGFYKNDIQDIKERVSMSLVKKPQNSTKQHSLRPTPFSVAKLSPQSKTKPFKKKIAPKKIAKKQNVSSNLEKIREYLYQLFKRSDLYDLGPVGREKINTKFGISVIETQLTALDIKETINWLSKLRAGKEEIDDIDHSQNRRVRTSSELIQTQFENGITRLRNVVTKKVRNGKIEQIKALPLTLRANLPRTKTKVLRCFTCKTLPFCVPNLNKTKFGYVTQKRTFLHAELKQNEVLVRNALQKQSFCITPFLHAHTYANLAYANDRLVRYRQSGDVSQSPQFKDKLTNPAFSDKPYFRGQGNCFVKDNKIIDKVKLHLQNKTTFTSINPYCITNNKKKKYYSDLSDLRSARQKLYSRRNLLRVFNQPCLETHQARTKTKFWSKLGTSHGTAIAQDAVYPRNNQLSHFSVSELFSTKPINGALREFFSSSPLSQYMDQTNPLAEITHKRRISSLGVGGVSRESAGMAIRGIHPTHYGRVCPIETPEGKNAGLVNSLAFYAKINNQGFIETPYYQVIKGQIQHELGFSFVSAGQESRNGLYIAPNDIKQSKSKLLATNISTVESIPVRVADTVLDIFKKVSPYNVDCIGISPVQILSVATSLIPFLEHNDANRALMGSNMQRQAVSLMISERPLVGTGLEARVLAESGHLVQSKVSGFVSSVSAHKVVVERLLHNLAFTSNKNPVVQKQINAKTSLCVAKTLFLHQNEIVATLAAQKLRFCIIKFYQNLVMQKRSLCKNEVMQKLTFLHARTVPHYKANAKTLFIPKPRYAKTKFMQKRSFCIKTKLYQNEVLVRHHKANAKINVDTSLVLGNRLSSTDFLKEGTCQISLGNFSLLTSGKTKEWSVKEKTMNKVGLLPYLNLFKYQSSNSVIETSLPPTQPNKSRVFSFKKKKLALLPVTHSISTFSRSNQETCLVQKPLVAEGDWVQKGDMVSDCSAGQKGELSVGKNMLIAYIPWQGYNFEDAIVISDRLVKEQLYTSLHIERYTVIVNDFKDKVVDTNEWFTGNLPGVDNKKRDHLQRSGLPVIGTILREGDILVGKIKYSKKKPATPHEKLVCDILGEHNFSVQNSSLYVPKGVHEARVLTYKIKKRFEKALQNNLRPAGAPKVVDIFLGEKRNIQVGDKMSGRHGNKGIVSTILPKQDMPYLADGSPIDILLNPLGVPSRMNVGQVFECLLGLASTYLQQNFKMTAFDELYGVEASQSLVFLKLYQARLQSGQNWLFQVNFPGKTRLTDGRSGECLDQWVTVGRAYMLKLIHMVNEKIHARAIGPYALVTQQPLKGRAHKGGQRLGEMEVWAVEGFGAAYILQELLTKKSDDSIGRKEVLKAMLPKSASFLDFVDPFNQSVQTEPRLELDNVSTYSKKENRLHNEGESFNVLGQPDIFKVLICELQALCLDVGVYSMKTESFQRQFLGILE